MNCKICVVIASIFISSCAYGLSRIENDPMDNYDPEDMIYVDEFGKIKIIEDHTLKEKHTDKGGRVCLEITLDGEYSRYDVKRCETNP